jgi:hypothetical protein
MKRKCMFIGFAVPVLAAIALLLLMVAVTGCDLLNFGEEEENETTIPDALKVVIGRGYDLTGTYADSAQVKRVAILDLGRLTEDGKILLDPNLSRGEFETISGSTISEYQSNLTVKVMVKGEGGVEGIASFAGEVGANFSSERTKSDDYAFATSRSLITKDAWFVDLDPTDLADSEYITDAFVKDVRDLEPDAVIAKYGTHVMLGGVLGARLDYSMSVRKIKETSSTEMGAYVKAKAEATIEGVKAGLETDDSVDSKYKDSFETTSLEIRTTAVGGKVEYAQNIQNTYKEGYDKWIESIEGKEKWSDYYPESLYPIYKLVGTDRWGDDGETLKAALKNAYDAYYEGKQITITTKRVNSEYPHNIPQGTIFGQAVKIAGDSEFASTNGKNLLWSVDVKLAASGKNVKADFVYTVKEEYGDATEMRITKSVTIPVNKDIVGLREPTSDYREGVINYSTKNYEAVPDEAGHILTNLKVRVDGDGNDENNIGLTASITVYFTERVSE